MDGLCTFNWNGLDGWPIGVTVKFLWLRERLWFICLSTAPRLKALQRDQRVSVVIGTQTKTVTAKGWGRIVDDRAERDEVFRVMGAKTAEKLGGSASDHTSRLCATNVVIEVKVHKWISYDLARSW